MAIMGQPVLLSVLVLLLAGSAATSPTEKAGESGPHIPAGAEILEVPGFLEAQDNSCGQSKGCERGNLIPLKISDIPGEKRKTVEIGKGIQSSAGDRTFLLAFMSAHAERDRIVRSLKSSGNSGNSGDVVLTGRRGSRRQLRDASLSSSYKNDVVTTNSNSIEKSPPVGTKQRQLRGELTNDAAASVEITRLEGDAGFKSMFNRAHNERDMLIRAQDKAAQSLGMRRGLRGAQLREVMKAEVQERRRVFLNSQASSGVHELGWTIKRMFSVAHAVRDTLIKARKETSSVAAAAGKAGVSSNEDTAGSVRMAIRVHLEGETQIEAYKNGRLKAPEGTDKALDTPRSEEEEGKNKTEDEEEDEEEEENQVEKLEPMPPYLLEQLRGGGR